MNTSEMTNYEKAEMMHALAYDAYPCKHKPDDWAASYYNRKVFTMFSYERAARMFWDRFIEELFEKGLNEDQVETLLRSKRMRWMFDQAEDLFEGIAKELVTDDMIQWAVNNTEEKE